MSLPRLFGHAAAEAAFLRELAGGTLHHAWMLEGPRGIGKAVLAERMAMAVLGVDLSAADSSLADAIAAGSHPDYKKLEREAGPSGKLKQDISVEQVRGFNRFFGLTAGAGGKRAGILDSLDELGPAGANALLKTLEEPTPGAVLIALSHQSVPLLPTIRSRCRVVRLAPLSDDDAAAAVRAAGERADSAALRVAQGRPGAAIRFSDAKTRSALRAGEALGKTAEPPGRDLRQAVLDAGQSEEAFDAFAAGLMHALAEQRTEGAAEAWLRASRFLAESREMNMPPPVAAAKLALLARSR